MRLRTVKKPARPKRAAKNLLGIYIKLVGSSPSVWRTAIVRDQLTFASFHRALSALLGSDLGGDYLFRRIERPETFQSERKIGTVLQAIGDQLIYSYFGNDHLVRVESMQPLIGDEPRLALCLNGEGQYPIYSDITPPSAEGFSVDETNHRIMRL